MIRGWLARLRRPEPAPDGWASDTVLEAMLAEVHLGRAGWVRDPSGRWHCPTGAALLPDEDVLALIAKANQLEPKGAEQVHHAP